MDHKFRISEIVTYEVDISTGPNSSYSAREALALRKLSTMPALERLDYVIMIEPHSVQEVVAPIWSEDHVRRAATQGWIITSHDDGSYHIESRDDVDGRLMKSDAAAHHWVHYQAEQGYELHQAALAYIRHMNKEA